MSVETLVLVAPETNKTNVESMPEMVAAAELVRQAKAAGLDLTGLDGLLKQFTKTVLETALNEEMTEHLGREKHAKSAEGSSQNIATGRPQRQCLLTASARWRLRFPGIVKARSNQ